ncbi:hypothetical protein QTP88_020742 [Uroleucon formosanum]
MNPTTKSNISSKSSPLGSGPVLRSASNGSTSTSLSKQTNNTYSNDDLMKAILEIQNSQSAQFQELRGCLTSLKNEISELKNENIALRHESSAISARVAQLESKLAVTSDSEVSSKLLREISERSSSEYNLSRALSPIQIALPTDFKLIRLVNNKARKPRPIKIICRSKESAAQLISEFRQAVRSGSSVRDCLRIIRDKTSLERELLRTAHIELENRNKSELGFTGLTIFRADRNVYTSTCTRGCGVLIAVRQTLCPSLLFCAVQSVEQLFIKLPIAKKHLLLIGGVYIPPSAPIELYTAHAETVDELWQSSGCNMGIICGDFNLPNVNWHNSVSGLSLLGTVNDNVKAMGDVYRFLDFSQNNSIRNQAGSLLDLVFTSEIDIVVDTSPDSLVMPDKYHPPLSITYSMPDVPPQLDDQHSFRNFNCADYNSITNILSSINWESDFKNLGIEAAANCLQTILITLIEQYVPVHIFPRSTFPKWAILKLKNLIIDKKIAHKKLKQFGTMHYRHRFSLLRSQVKLESRLAYESYLSKINTSLQKDPHQFWSFINNRRNTSGIPNVMHYGDIIASDVDIANLFALLFNSVYKSPLPPTHWNAENIGIKSFTFLPSRLTIDSDEVEENLSSLRTTKSRGPDGISAQFLFAIRAQLKYPLLYVFNLSLAEGVFPSI